MDPKVTAMFSQLRTLLVVIGTAMSMAGLENTGPYKWVMIASGVVTIVGPAAWDFFASVKGLLTAQAVGVQAGIKMTVQGKALASDGETVITKFGAGADATPPKAVTIETAQQIVKDFGPTVPPQTA